MNGVHDLGGMDGFGPVDVEANEPVFHQPWERLVFGLVGGSVQRSATCTVSGMPSSVWSRLTT